MAFYQLLQLAFGVNCMICTAGVVAAFVLTVFPSVELSDDEHCEHLSSETTLYEYGVHELRRWHQYVSDRLFWLLLRSSIDSVYIPPVCDKCEPMPAPPPVVKYEDKYMDKYSAMSSEHLLNETERERIRQLAFDFSAQDSQDADNDISPLRGDIETIREIMCGGCECMIQFIYGQSELNILAMGLDEGDMEKLSIANLEQDCAKEIQLIEDKIADRLSKKQSPDDCHEQALGTVLGEKYAPLMNNYIMEQTPVGGIFMRYNQSRNAFEYYSNHSVPYRYLETVGRKYVTTFNCRALFVDMNEQLSNGRKVLAADAAKDNAADAADGAPSATKTNVFAKFKQYNVGAGVKPTSLSMPQPPASAASSNRARTYVLKEESNTYTCLGRASSFPMIKPVDKSLVDKNHLLTFAQFMDMSKTKTSTV